VEDCLDGMFCAIGKSEEQCGVYNLGCESFTRVTKIAEIVSEEMGLNGTKFSYTGGARGWLGDVPIVHFDIEKMRRFGWQPKHTSDEAVRIATRRLLGKAE